MSTREELEALPAQELHDRAVALAKHHWDIGFLRRLIKSVPAAEAAIGDVGDAEADVADSFNAWSEMGKAGDPELEDALKPLYVDYLLEHEK
jgi:hypothetical protein